MMAMRLGEKAIIATCAITLVSIGYAIGYNQHAIMDLASAGYVTHCPTKPLDGVHDPERLHVLSPCVYYEGWVTGLDAEKGSTDLDLRYKVKPMASYLHYLDANETRDGAIVAEVVPQDQHHVPELHDGDYVALVGAWVDDTAHDHYEIHPVTYAYQLRKAPI